MDLKLCALSQKTYFYTFQRKRKTFLTPQAPTVTSTSFFMRLKKVTNVLIFQEILPSSTITNLSRYVRRIWMIIIQLKGFIFPNLNHRCNPAT